jgi:serine/threonine-protein kinase
MDFVPGALVAGRYRLRRMVGAGGMGEVWSGEDVKSGARVAVKRLLPAAAKHHEVIARFKREAYLLGRVTSDYSAKVIDFIDDEAFGLVLTMDFIDGPSLAHILEERSLSVEEALDLAADLLHALVNLHAAKIVHRDLKPGNIIMRPMPQARSRATIVDFGISRLLTGGGGDGEVTGITRANIALGTVEYMAPEQILNSRDVTAVTDLYAIGIILFRAVKGRHAFGDRRGEELARAKLIEEAPGLDTGRRDPIAEGLSALVARALKKRPAQRFQSAESMLEEVERLQSLARIDQPDTDTDFDDTTTDGGRTAVKHSPLSHQSGVSPAAILPAAGAPARAAQSGVSAAVRPQQPQARAQLHSVPEAVPMRAAPPESGRSPMRSDPRASDPRASDPRASMPDPRASMPDPRASMPDPRMSMPDSRASIPPDVAPPPPTVDRNATSTTSTAAQSLAILDAPTVDKSGSGLSKGTVALAVVTAFAVGLAVGLVIAPSGGASKSAAAPAESGAARTTAEVAATAPPGKSAAGAVLASAPPTSSVLELDDAPPTATASVSAKPVAALTGKMPTTAWTPPKPTSTGASTGAAPTAAPTDVAPPPTATAPPPPTGETPPPPPPAPDPDTGF